MRQSVEQEPGPVEKSADALLGHVFDETYRLDALLDKGGMGTVYQATNIALNRAVAVKVLNAKFSCDARAQERFRHEAIAAASVKHANAIEVLDFGQTSSGLAYIVMELLQGQSLRDIIALEAPFDAARAVSIMLKISAAVAAAHAAGIVHRDLKPSNVFVAQRLHAPATVKVIDFGIAQLLSESEVDHGRPQGGLTGTPRYMSPEQFQRAALTPASDVYSLGLMLYEMLAAVTPFNCGSASEYATSHAQEAPLSPRTLVPSVPLPLDRFVMTCLSKHPQHRPADAAVFLEQLRTVGDELGLERYDVLGPSLEQLQLIGRQSPSGSLVIDLAQLRETRAANPSGEVKATDQQSSSVPDSGTGAAAHATVRAEPEADAGSAALRRRPLDSKLKTWTSNSLNRLAVMLTVFFVVLILISFLLKQVFGPAPPALTPQSTAPRSSK